MTGSAAFPGVKDNLDQLNKIFSALGTPTEQTWPGVTKYRYFNNGMYKAMSILCF